MKERLLKKVGKIIEENKSKNIFWRFVHQLKDTTWEVYHNPSILKFNLKFLTQMRREKKILKKIKKMKMKKYYKLSFCTTCKNRTLHLKQTFIKNIQDNIDYPNIEFVLLDYNSKDDMQDWAKKNLQGYLKKGIVKYYQTKRPRYFKMCHAKNLAHKLATGDIVCNLDADNLTGKDFAFYINYMFNANQKRILSPPKEEDLFGNSGGHLRGTGGRRTLMKEDFLKLRGYDEELEGWTWDDLELTIRAERYGLKRLDIPVIHLKCIVHGNEERIANYDLSGYKSKNYDEITREKIKENAASLDKNINIPLNQVNKKGFGIEKVTRLKIR